MDTAFYQHFLESLLFGPHSACGIPLSIYTGQSGISHALGYIAYTFSPLLMIHIVLPVSFITEHYKVISWTVPTLVFVSLWLAY